MKFSAASHGVSRAARRLASEGGPVDPLDPILGKLDGIKYATLAASWQKTWIGMHEYIGGGVKMIQDEGYR